MMVIILALPDGMPRARRHRLSRWEGSSRVRHGVTAAKAALPRLDEPATLRRGVGTPPATEPTGSWATNV